MHTTMPSLFQGEHLVVYATPGCNVPTVACVCRTAAQAIIEADRLNVAQLEQEKAAQQAQVTAGLRRLQFDLEGEH